MLLFSSYLLQVNLFLIEFMPTMQFKCKLRPGNIKVLLKLFLISEKWWQWQKHTALQNVLPNIFQILKFYFWVRWIGYIYKMCKLAMSLSPRWSKICHCHYFFGALFVLFLWYIFPGGTHSLTRDHGVQVQSS